MIARHKMKVCALVLIVVAGCMAATKPGSVDVRVRDLFGGEANVAPVLKPAKVEAFRVASARIQPAGDAVATKKIGDWPITSGPITVDAKTAAELTAVFSNPATYDWDSAKGCEFDPGVAFRFTDESGSTDVLLCFSCDEMAVVRGGKRIGGEDTDSARQKLVAIAKRLFPQDEAIQALDKP